MIARILGIALSLVALASTAATPPTAIRQLTGIRKAMIADKARGDWLAFKADAERQQTFLHGSPASRLEVARAQLELGDQAGAIQSARTVLAMGDANPVLGSPLFAPVKAVLGAEIDADNAAVDFSVRTIDSGDASLVAEDVDFDPKTGRFFISSIVEPKVVALRPGGRGDVFAVGPDRWPMMALKIDARRRRLWVTEVALRGFTAVPVPEQGRSALLQYDLDSGVLLARIEGPPGSALGDMALASGGEPIVSDGDGGGIYRLTRGKLHRLDRGDFISPQTPTFCGDERTLFVPDYLRGVAALDTRTGAVRWLKPDGHALEGIDGLYCRGGWLMATQNGSSPPRVVAFRLSADRARIASETVIERSPGADFTHGVFDGDDFYFIAAAGWNQLDDHGVGKPTAALVAPEIRLARRPEALPAAGW